MNAFLAAMTRVPDLLAAHLLVAGSALLLGLAISLPLAVWSARHPNIARLTLGFASLVQTIPSLALLALFYPLLLTLGAVLGSDVPALGFLPSLLALTLYALLPILRNGITGLNGLDPAVIEAADGVGMTWPQKLRLVELPLVAPVLMAGIRTAATWTIGAATLSTTVGQPSLGDIIFAGLQTQNWALVLVGCLSAAALALTVDALLGRIEHGIRRRRRAQVWIAAALLALGTTVALAPIWARGGDERVVTIGAKGFAEQFILARVIGHQLERAGYRVRYREGLGSAVVFGALRAGDIDVTIDYTGTIWTNEMKRADVPERPAMLAAIGAWEKTQGGVTLIGPLGFENAYCFAMRGSDARQRGITTIDDLVPLAGGMAFASDPEFLERPEWAAIRRLYPLRFKSAQAYSPTFMYRALDSGRADVISAYTSDGRIAAQDLVVLADPRRAIPRYDAILQISGNAARDRRLTGALSALIGRIDVRTMRSANFMVDRDDDKKSPDEAARWLEMQVGLEARAGLR